MFDNLRQDTRRLKAIKSKGFPGYVIESLLFENGYQAVVLYRLAHWFKRRRLPFFGPLFGRLSIWLTGVEIAPAAVVGPGLLISHGQGIVVGQWARLGAHCHLHQQVTLGAKDVGRIDAMPKLGDRVVIGAGAKVLGAVEIGDDALVGPNAFVTRDVPAGGKALAPYAEIRGPASS
ncbi:MAG: serine O-acetyltransferase [Acidobacteriota bacterium]